MIFDPMYLLFIAPALLFSLWASWRTRSNFKKYSRVTVSSGLTGAQAAQRILDGAGIHDVSISHARGILTDHYNPGKKTLALSQGVTAHVPLPPSGSRPTRRVMPFSTRANTVRSRSARCWSPRPASARTSGT